jgi:uncharacterized protein (TIGR00255 family)
MTGYGQAVGRAGETSCAVEIRTVNNRFLKTQIRLPDRLTAWESRLEKLIRGQVRRGTVTLAVRLEGKALAQPARLDAHALAGYFAQLRAVAPVELSQVAGALLPLPGVVVESAAAEDWDQRLWPLVEQVAGEALTALKRMRAEEGTGLRTELEQLATEIAGLTDQIERRNAAAVPAHRDRLADRVRTLLAPHQLELSPQDLVRELSVLAERCDIAEEVARLRGHRLQLVATLGGGEHAGRKLDFLAQELHREANTIGAKANDLPTQELAVELKTRIERLRELVQNVE